MEIGNYFITVSLTTLGTVISGIVVFIIGQILTHIWLTPLKRYKEIKEEIAYTLSFYACYYTNVIDLADNHERQNEKYREIAQDLRALSCKLLGFIETLSFIKFGIPKKECLFRAHNNLLAISNNLFTPYNSKGNMVEQGAINKKWADEIRSELRLFQGNRIQEDEK